MTVNGSPYSFWVHVPANVDGTPPFEHANVLA